MAHIKLNGFIYTVFLKIIESRILPNPEYQRLPSNFTMVTGVQQNEGDRSQEKVVGLQEEILTIQSAPNDESYSYGDSTQLGQEDRCAILVMSNQGQTSLQQSLLRKYRYNQDGDLIPSSVQYFIKFPQEKGTAILVPLKDRSFSSNGGFVRYYKEVPPIPQSWKR